MSVGKLLASKALGIVPRALGLCDRKENSRTSGCCDRMFWHYRIIDFANARYQEAGFLFALAYSVNLSANMFYGKETLKKWSRNVWRFWLRDRNRDGSTHEVYPNERSFCSTAFSAAAFVETVLIFGNANEWAEEIKLCESTIIWLANNRNNEVANQMAASLLAITGYSVLTGNGRFVKLARRRREEVLLLADKNGVFPEYGGLDTGYQSITMSALTRAMLLSDDGILEEVLRKGEKILAEKIGPHGQTDYSKNSRGTQYIYPYALVTLKSELLDRIAKGLEEETILTPSWMDDRYCIAMAVDYFMAAKELALC